MIARLHGPLVAKAADHAVLDVGGVGYEVHVPALALDDLPLLGEPVTLHVHTHVREDAITLFGFTHPGERTLFLRLLGVTGVGPRLALQALGTWGGTALRDMLIQGDEKQLARTPGIGKRTAQRLVLELADKVAGIDTGGSPAPAGGVAAAGSADVLDDLALALQNLGYAGRQVEDTCARLAGSIQPDTDVRTLLREALRILKG